MRQYNLYLRNNVPNPEEETGMILQLQEAEKKSKA
jgi:hypothetical protein